MNNETHYYTPDFIMNGIYYEIKNWHRPDTDFKIKYFPKDKKLILIEGKKQNNLYLDYVKQKYGKNFYEKLYENSSYKCLSKKESEYLNSLNKLKDERWKQILQSNIDFTKYGWTKKLSKIFGISSRKVADYVKRNFPSFYNEKCFKPNKS